MELIRIGWREWISMPELDIDRIKVKVDTGARTSSLHAYDVEMYRRGQKRYVRFSLHPIQRNNNVSVPCKAPLLEERHVRSSNGAREFRPVIRTMIEVAGKQWPIEITLTSRYNMGFRMLLWREAIRRRCKVDEGRSNPEIRQFFKDRYGQYVLLRPPVDGAGLLIWLFPFILLLGVGGALAMRMFARRRKELEPLDEG